MESNGISFERLEKEKGRL